VPAIAVVITTETVTKILTNSFIFFSPLKLRLSEQKNQKTHNKYSVNISDLMHIAFSSYQKNFIDLYKTVN